MPRTINSFRAALGAALVLAASALPARSASAQTATLNFNTIADSNIAYAPNNYTESGYVVTALSSAPTDPLAFASYGPNYADYTGSPALFLNSDPTGDVGFARQDGGLFSFQSIGLAPFLAGDNTTVIFRGFTPGSGSLAADSMMYTVTQPGLQTFSFANFTGLSSLRMSTTNQYGDPVQFDNVSFTGAASTVPEPGTFGLVATGLIGMAGAVRRRPTRKTPPSEPSA